MARRTAKNRSPEPTGQAPSPLKISRALTDLDPSLSLADIAAVTGRIPLSRAWVILRSSRLLGEVPWALRSDVAFAEQLLDSPEGQSLADTVWTYWWAARKKLIALPWQACPADELVALGLGRAVEEASGAFLAVRGLAPPGAGLTLVLIAYVGRIVRDGAEAGRVAADLYWACGQLLAMEEFWQRAKKHPAGCLLLVATALPQLPGISLQEQAAWQTLGRERWLRLALRSLSIWVRRRLLAGQGSLAERTYWIKPRRGDHGELWVKGVLDEGDRDAAREEAVGLLSRRLAEEEKRLRKQPRDRLLAALITGRLDYHKVSAEQSVLRGQRPKRERHQLISPLSNESKDPRDPGTTNPDQWIQAKRARRTLVRFHTEPPDPGDLKPRPQPEVGSRHGAISPPDPEAWDAPHEMELAAENPELVATVIRAYRLPPARARVIRFITAHPESHRFTRPEIAEGAKASLRTVEETIKQLASDRATLLRILFPQ